MTQTEIKHQVWGVLLGAIKFLPTQTAHEIEALIATASKEDAIAFGQWLHKKQLDWRTNGWYETGTDNEYTTSELYDIYSADKNKEGI